MVLIVFLSSRISPFTSTVIFFDKSPFATAVVTSAILRICPVRLPAMLLTESVKSYQVPATSGTWGGPPGGPAGGAARAARGAAGAGGGGGAAGAGGGGF